ncbi:30S ribosomal protein S19 [archaeon]|jgi:small subunit ribosomal protein S19|nr:30S ribosomal protein S19 [archaeon]
MADELAQKSKEKFYRGLEVEELKKLDTREFAKLVKSRARRFLLRNGSSVEKFVAKCDKNAGRNKPIKTHDRELVIVPRMIGNLVQVYNGKEFVKVVIVPEMLGHRLGEFSLTRKIAKHTSVGVGASKKK